MHCALCRSSNLAEFGTEILIHFCGLKNLDKPPVWAFPKISVCLDCGSSRLTIPKTELALLAGVLRQVTAIHSRTQIADAHNLVCDLSERLLETEVDVVGVVSEGCARED